MSNELVLSKSNVPAYARSHTSALAASMQSSGESVPRISIKGKRFKFIKNDSEQQLPAGANLNVVVLGVDPPEPRVMAKSYYKAKYAPGSDDPPDCGSDNGVIPSDYAREPQSKTCATCPHNVWGSRIDDQGKKRKACEDSKRLLVVNPKAIDGTVYRIQVPSGSFKALTEYSKTLTEHGAALETLVTEIAFVDESEYPQLTFKPLQFLDDTAGPAAIARASSDDIQSLLHFPPAAVPVADIKSPPPVAKATSAASTPAQQAEPDGWDDAAPAAGSDAPEESDGWGDTVQNEPPAAADNPYVDIHGVAYNPNEHAWDKARNAPSKLKDGSFRSKRATSNKGEPADKAPPNSSAPQAAAPKAKAAPASDDDDGASDLASLISDWV